MTIAIGLLCNHGNNILLTADTLISYANVSSNPGGGKIYESKNGIYAAVANDVSTAHIVVSHFLGVVDNLDPSDPSYLDKIKIQLQASCAYAFKWWRHEILQTVNLTEDEYLHDNNLSRDKKNEAEVALYEAAEQGLPIEIIVAGFGATHPIFFHTDGRMITEQSSPGNFFAGSGSDAARDWLNYRGQNVHCSWEMSYYHLLEALHFARLSRAVGSTRAVLLLGPTGEVYALERLPKSKNEKATSRLFKKYWSRPTTTAFTDGARKQICDASNVPFRRFAGASTKQKGG